MSLTSYRAAPPRGGGDGIIRDCGLGRAAAWCGQGMRWGDAIGQCDLGGCDGVGRGVCGWGLREPGGDLLFRVLRRSTIGAEGFHGRVRDGIGCLAPRCGHQAVAAPVP